MRRPIVLLAVPTAMFLLPAPSASAVCVSSTGITVCPTIYTCGPGSVISMTAVGTTGRGTASCGGGTASCMVFRVGCNALGTATSAGILTCSATGTVVATCSVTIAAT